MIANTRPDRTLQEVFAAVFYQNLGWTSRISTRRSRSFTRSLPSLQVYTRQLPEAVEFVSKPWPRLPVGDRL
jgi:hypothetical protein